MSPVLALLVALGGISGPVVELVGAEHLSQEERRAWHHLSARLPPLERVHPLRLQVAPSPTADGLDDGALDDAAFHLTLHPVLPAPQRDRGVVFARAVLFAVFWNLDHRAAWSRQRRWRTFNDWRMPFSGPLTWSTGSANEHPGGFVSARGRESPRADLAQWAAELWLEEPGSDGVSCRYPDRIRWLRARMIERWGEDAVPRAPACPKLERWANLERLHSIEVLLASPSAASAGSLFGHLALRLVYRDERGDTPLHLSRTIAFLADSDDPVEDDPLYPVKGITGQYSAVVHERPFLHTVREYVLQEDRDLRRWRLELSPEETRDLMDRLYTMQHSMQVPYYFFLRNCATLLFDTINGAFAPGHGANLDERLTAGPAAVVEALLRAKNASGASRLTFLPESVTSGGTEARWSSAERRAVVAELLRVAPELEAPLHASQSPVPNDRAAAYQSLGSPLAHLPQRELVHRFWHHTAVIEAHLNAAHNLRRQKELERERRRELREVRRELEQRVTRALEATDHAATWELCATALASAEREERMEGYVGLEAMLSSPGAPDPAVVNDLRRLVLLTSELEHDVAALKAVPGLRGALVFPEPKTSIEKQPYVRGYEHLIRYPSSTEIAAPVIAAQKARLLAAPGSGPALAKEVTQVRTDAEAHHHDRALPETGLDAFGVSVMMDPDNPALTSVALSGAMYNQRLGDQRQQDFDPFTELVVARSRVQWAAPRGRPYVLQSQVRWLGLRRLGKGLHEADGLWQRIGWYGHVESETDRRRRLAFLGRVEAGVSVLLWERERLADHIIVDVGAAYDLQVPRDDEGEIAHNLAIPMRLALRYSLWPEHSFGHVLHASVTFDPRVDPVLGQVVPQVRAQLETQARLTGDLELPWLGPTALHAVASARYDYNRPSYRQVPEHRVTVLVGVMIP